MARGMRGGGRFRGGHGRHGHHGGRGRGRRWGRGRGWGGGWGGWGGGWGYPGYVIYDTYDPCDECYDLPPYTQARERCLLVKGCSTPLGQSVSDLVVRETAGAAAGTIARGAIILGVAVVGLSWLANVFVRPSPRRNRRRSR
jgi:hypothetical protein